jgi:hypothetical protein
MDQLQWTGSDTGCFDDVRHRPQSYGNFQLEGNVHGLWSYHDISWDFILFYDASWT